MGDKMKAAAIAAIWLGTAIICVGTGGSAAAGAALLATFFVCIFG